MLTFLSLPLKGFRSKQNASWNPLYPAARGLKIVIRAQLPTRADLPEPVKLKREKSKRSFY